MVHLRAPDCVACMPGQLAEAIAQQPDLLARWRALPQRHVPTGGALLRLGESPRHLWWIRHGLVRFYFLSSQGLEHNKSFHAEGAWIGSGMPPRPSPSLYAIQALEDTVVVELSYADLTDALRRFPGVAALHEDVLGWTFTKHTQREAELLSEDPATRYQRFIREQPGLAARLPLHQVASHLGITSVALSRIRRRLGLRNGQRA